jgi:hypothetical protein
VEAALAVAALVAVVMLCVGGLAAISAQVRCLDAAREAARLTARGADQSVAFAVHNIAPRGAVVRIRRDGEFVVATVAVDAALLPWITVSADAVAVAEPGA